MIFCDHIASIDINQAKPFLLSVYADFVVNTHDLRF